MSYMTYNSSLDEKEIFWLHGETKTPITPQTVIDTCKKRLANYDATTR